MIFDCDTRSVTLAMVIMVISAVSFRIAFAQTGPNIPPDLIAAVLKDSKTDENLKQCIEEEPGARPLEDQLIAWPFDLGRRQKTWQVYGPRSCAGAQNGPLFVYIRVGNGWRMIAEGFGQGFSVCTKGYEPPCPSPKGTGRGAGAHHWPDLALWMHGSATTGDQTVYRYDGRMYKPVLCASVGSATEWAQPRYFRCPAPQNKGAQPSDTG